MIGLLPQTDIQVLEVIETTDLQVELHLMNYSHRHLVILLGKNIIVKCLGLHQREARGMMPWERLSFRYPSPLFLSVLSKSSSLVALTNLLLPFIVVKLILLNT